MADRSIETIPFPFFSIQPLVLTVAVLSIVAVILADSIAGAGWVLIDLLGVKMAHDPMRLRCRIEAENAMVG